MADNTTETHRGRGRERRDRLVEGFAWIGFDA